MHSAGLVMKEGKVFRANGVSIVEEALTEDPRGVVVIMEAAAEAVFMVVEAVADSMEAEAAAAGKDFYLAKTASSGQ